ncbi:MAG: GAF domain-containing protein [Cyanothece sp. SIO1E1]|nr:GAF domain-containing protein [Cyanothece sp. SIO1E1]
MEKELAEETLQPVPAVSVSQSNLASCQSFSEQQKALTGVIARIRASLDLDTILKTTVTEVRQLLEVDRVGVFRFYPDLDWQGKLISEDVASKWPSAMSMQVHDHCFSERFAALYQQGRINALSDIYQAGLSDCYVQILEQFQVRANLVAPLLKGNALWGLLCVHQCRGPRNWEAAEIEFANQIAAHLGVALQQADYIEQVQVQSAQLAQARERAKALEQQKTLAITIDRIRRSLNIDTIFNTTTHEVQQLLKSDRVAIYRFNPDWSGEFVAESIVKGGPPLMGAQFVITDTHLQAIQERRYTDSKTFAIDDIYQVEHTACQVELLESKLRVG